VKEVMASEFNCRSIYSDDAERNCAELDFARTGIELIGAFKTPSLRNLENTAPFMHKGQLATLADVLEHYNEAPDAMIGHNEAKPLGLGKRELQQIEAFLNTLAAPVEF
jgi:cytochrome c peroxidase